MRVITKHCPLTRGKGARLRDRGLLAETKGQKPHRLEVLENNKIKNGKAVKKDKIYNPIEPHHKIPIIRHMKRLQKINKLLSKPLIRLIRIYQMTLSPDQ